MSQSEERKAERQLKILKDKKEKNKNLYAKSLESPLFRQRIKPPNKEPRLNKHQIEKLLLEEDKDV
jgi:hypothetical protein